MLQRLLLKANNRMVALTGVVGVGLLPCPDCGLPLAVKIWPVAGAYWLWRRFRQRSAERLDLLLSDDLVARASPTSEATGTGGDR